MAPSLPDLSRTLSTTSLRLTPPLCVPSPSVSLFLSPRVSLALSLPPRLPLRLPRCLSPSLAVPAFLPRPLSSSDLSRPPPRRSLTSRFASASLFLFVSVLGLFAVCAPQTPPLSLPLCVSGSLRLSPSLPHPLSRLFSFVRARSVRFAGSPSFLAPLARCRRRRCPSLGPRRPPRTSRARRPGRLPPRTGSRRSPSAPRAPARPGPAPHSRTGVASAGAGRGPDAPLRLGPGPRPQPPPTAPVLRVAPGPGGGRRAAEARGPRAGAERGT